MAKTRTKLKIEWVVDLLNNGHTVFDVARMAGEHEYNVRYVLKRNGYRKVVKWERIDNDKR